MIVSGNTESPGMVTTASSAPQEWQYLAYWFVMFIGYGSFTLTCVQVWFTSILIIL